MSNVIELSPNKEMSQEQLNQLVAELNAKGYLVINRVAADAITDIASSALADGSPNSKDLALRIILQNFTNLLSMQPLTN
ncbi:hypothetical protein PR1_1 [Providencia phage vB_PreS_PR1]|uniref:Uncharacterized protein n=1 Tax=Providencia phage vB_PreS_PR1 TaxID=1931407 RepID=A0A1S6KV71_9CAUD|nr:hypothetical protein FDH30_gp001 [Providencia phage vB_PreS_PR1]AQT25338.1 hypothetical protein PR1_1 [Providencia phage vB_PreS_PR1]